MATTDVLFTADALANTYTGSNPATRDQAGDIMVLDFDAATDEFCEFVGVMPNHYAGTTGVTLTIYSKATSASTGNFAWEAAFSSITSSVDNPSSSAFAAVQTTSAVATAEILNETILSEDIQDGTIVALDIATSAVARRLEIQTIVISPNADTWVAFLHDAESGDIVLDVTGTVLK